MRNKRFLLILAMVILVLIGAVFTIFVIRTKSSNFHGIVINHSSVDDVIKNLGTPNKIGVDKGYTVYYYLIPGTNRSNKVYLSNGIVQYLTEEIVIDNTRYSDYVVKSKRQEDGVLYVLSQYANGFNWYVFANDGEAFLANKRNGYTLEVLYFSPRDYQTFLSTTAIDFSLFKSPPAGEEKF